MRDFLFPQGQPIVLNRRIAQPGAYDEYGVQQYSVSSTTVNGVAIWPESSSEVGQGNERTNVVYHVALPLTVSVDAVDFVTWRGKDYQVQGDPEFHLSPLSGTQLQTIRINRVEG